MGKETFSEDEKLGKLYINAPKPPMIYVNTFFGVGISDIKLYVPEGSSSQYKKTITWKRFKNMKEM